MITFKGVQASTHNVVVNKLPPFKRATQRINTIKIDGKDGVVTQELGYDGYVLPVVITLMDVSKVNDVIAWLSGEGQLINSDDPTRYVNACVYNEVSYERLTTLKQAKVEFLVKDPFRYLLSESNTTITSAGNVTNSGTYKSLPLIKLTGSGLVTVSINGRQFTYNFDTPYVYIDSQSQEAYHLNVSKNRKLGGDFPFLDVGVNAISWTGTVTEMVITKRTRYL